MSSRTGISSIIVLGIVLRIAQFLFNRSLTEGEAPLALNILERSYAGLLQPLGYVQAAPIGFLISEKFASTMLGTGEMALRLFPLIAGILALVLFWQVVKKTLERSAIPVALLLFSVGDHLIYFASEVKPYSGDVMVGLLIILSCLWVLQNKLQPRYVLLLGVIGAVGFWFSYPAVFVFTACILVSVLWILHTKKYRMFWWLSIACLAALTSFLVQYLAVLRSSSTSPELLTFWQHAFAPLPPRSLSDIAWYGYVFLRMFKFPLGLWEYGLILAVISFFTGCVVQFRKCRAVLGVVMFTLIFTFFASGLQLYPFEGRLLLFLTPLMLLPLALGIVYLAKAIANTSRLLGAVVVLLLIAYPVANAGYRLIQPRAPEELRPALEYVVSQYQDGDVLYVYYGAYNAFRYYQGRIGYTGDHIVGAESRDDWSGYNNELQGLQGKKRVWILFSHVATAFGADEEQLFISYLNTMGERIDMKLEPGAAAYLYDLSP
ncbi:MAG: glycosyltransferase family 39 protein [candidate division WOR-3 bacterium]|nr:MAG: glycosyltransferase family 39 protein [candidate division WOR-3 bacterium]